MIRWLLLSVLVIAGVLSAGIPQRERDHRRRPHRRHHEEVRGVKAFWKQHAPKFLMVGEVTMWASAIAAALQTHWISACSGLAFGGIWSRWRIDAKQRREGTDRASLLEDRKRMARTIRLMADPKTRSAAMAVVDAKPRIWEASE